MGWGEETVKPGDPTTSLVEAMVLDDAIWNADKKQRTEVAPANPLS
jgi:hypothetical protein